MKEWSKTDQWLMVGFEREHNIMMGASSCRPGRAAAWAGRGQCATIISRYRRYLNKSPQNSLLTIVLLLALMLVQ